MILQIKLNNKTEKETENANEFVVLNKIYFNIKQFQQNFKFFFFVSILT